MNNLRQAAQAALEALRMAADAWGQPDFPGVAVTKAESDLEAALAEPQPEPVTASVGPLGHAMDCPYCQLGFTYVTQQPQPSPMSEPNRLIAYSAAQKLRDLGYDWDGEAWRQGVIKEPQPEPVADDIGKSLRYATHGDPVYAAPQAQPLGYEQIVAIWAKHMKTRVLPNYEDFARDIEAAHKIGVKR